tara:strand:+ start:4544 stop:4813 length:270 start_codon:yes stop_codon:yes gene_type:complete
MLSGYYRDIKEHESIIKITQLNSKNFRITGSFENNTKWIALAYEDSKNNFTIELIGSVKFMNDNKKFLAIWNPKKKHLTWKDGIVWKSL